LPYDGREADLRSANAGLEKPPLDVLDPPLRAVPVKAPPAAGDRRLIGRDEDPPSRDDGDFE
jgi:hypothetical protein